jgi:hypothetical protein
MKFNQITALSSPVPDTVAVQAWRGVEWREKTGRVAVHGERETGRTVTPQEDGRYDASNVIRDCEYARLRIFVQQ